jgi:2-polyprenyl-6-methoxyphenol hydroxylase-like FAD-dependent oxidoreductase
MTILIVGGGIGGLTAALSFHQIAVEARVFESVAEPKGLGVGINILPHAARELIELGLGDRLEAIGVRTATLAYYSKHGKLIWEEPRGMAAGYKWPQFSVHRGELRELLSEAVKERLGAEAILTGHHFFDLTENPTGVTAEFVDRQSGNLVGGHEGALLVAADGIHSAVRAKFYPDEGPPKWNRSVLWRGVTMRAPFRDGRTMVMVGHEAQKLVCYPISPVGSDGLQMINWVAELRLPVEYEWRRESYNRRARLGDFLPAFEDWTFDWLDVPRLIRDALYVYEYPMVDRDPLDRWTFGHATLLGDAAHPMYPIGSNGASQAILDARVIAKAILEHGEMPAALEAYEADRRPATSRLVDLNRKNGPDQVMQIVEERAPGGFSRIDDVIPLSEREAIAAGYKKAAGFDRDALNSRPPIVPIPG